MAFGPKRSYFNCLIIRYAACAAFARPEPGLRSARQFARALVIPSACLQKVPCAKGMAGLLCIASASSSTYLARASSSGVWNVVVLVGSFLFGGYAVQMRMLGVTYVLSVTASRVCRTRRILCHIVWRSREIPREIEIQREKETRRRARARALAKGEQRARVSNLLVRQKTCGAKSSAIC